MIAQLTKGKSKVNCRFSPSVHAAPDYFCDRAGMLGRAERTKVPELRALRERAGLNGAELAEIVGLSASMISQLENGRKGASHKTLLRLSKALNCTIEQLSSPGEYPKPLSDFLANVAPEDITDDEIETLRAMHIPGRRITARAYNNLLDAMRNSERLNS